MFALVVFWRYDEPMSKQHEMSNLGYSGNPEYLHPSIENALSRALKIKAEDAIDPNLFVDVYTEDAVARDLKYVEDMKKLFSQENLVQKKYSDVFEAIIYQHVSQSNWLGEDAHTILVSEYDDIANGMDVAVRVDNTSNTFPYLGMGVDVTFGTTGVSKKMSRIFNEIDSGRLGKIRYFMDPEFDDRFKGELSKIPHLVVGVKRDHVQELATDWMNKPPRVFADNPIQLVILQQIMEQLKVFRDYATKIGKHDLADVYAADMAVFAPILRDRRKMDIRNYENDPVAKALAEELSARSK